MIYTALLSFPNCVIRPSIYAFPVSPTSLLFCIFSPPFLHSSRNISIYIGKVMDGLLIRTPPLSSEHLDVYQLNLLSAAESQGQKRYR